MIKMSKTQKLTLKTEGHTIKNIHTISKLQMFKQFRLYDKHPKKGGKMIYESPQTLCKSFVIAFLQMIFCGLKGEQTTIKSYTGTDRYYEHPSAINLNEYWFQIWAEDDNDNYGIQIGTDNTAEDNEDHTLIAKISKGSGAGQMEYDDHAYEPTQVVGANVDFEIRRLFTNVSGGAITIQEIGIMIESTDYIGDERYCLIAREAGIGLAVAHGITAEVVITFRQTV